MKNLYSIMKTVKRKDKGTKLEENKLLLCWMLLQDIAWNACDMRVRHNCHDEPYSVYLSHYLQH